MPGGKGVEESGIVRRKNLFAHEREEERENRDRKWDRQIIEGSQSRLILRSK